MEFLLAFWSLYPFVIAFVIASAAKQSSFSEFELWIASSRCSSQ
jgi:hypothetical protein